MRLFFGWEKEIEKITEMSRNLGEQANKNLAREHRETPFLSSCTSQSCDDQHTRENETEPYVHSTRDHNENTKHVSVEQVMRVCNSNLSRVAFVASRCDPFCSFRSQGGWISLKNLMPGQDRGRQLFSMLLSTTVFTTINSERESSDSPAHNSGSAVGVSLCQKHAVESRRFVVSAMKRRRGIYTQSIARVALQLPFWLNSKGLTCPWWLISLEVPSFIKLSEWKNGKLVGTFCKVIQEAQTVGNNTTFPLQSS